MKSLFQSILLIAGVAFITTLDSNGVQAFQHEIDSDLTEKFDELPEVKDPGKPLELVYKPKAGDEWTYKMKVDSVSDTMGMQMPKKDLQVIKIKIDLVGESGFQFTSRITELVSEMTTRGGSLRIDTINPELEKADGAFVPLLEIWKRVREAELTCRSSFEGEILDFSVPESITKAVEETGNPYGISAKDLTVGFLIGFFNLPDKAVAVGDQWEVQTVVIPLDLEEAKQTATLLGTAEVDGIEVAVIQIEFTAEREEKTGMISDIDINSKTIVLFDLAAGNVKKVFVDSENEMVIHVGQNEMFQTTNGTAIYERIDE